MSATKSERALATIRKMPIFRGPEGVVYVNGQVVAVPSPAFSRLALAAFVAVYPGETLGTGTLRSAIDALTADVTLAETTETPPPPPVRLCADGERDGRPDIVLVPDTHVATAQMIDALGADPELYVRGGALAHVIRSQPLKNGSGGGSPVTRSVPLSWLVDRVSMHARCLDYDTKLHVPPRADSVKAVLEHGTWHDVRELRGIAEAPFLRPDGTVCQVPGFDPATGYLYEPSAKFQAVPDEPTQEECAKALERLREPFDDFPYVDPAHRYAAVSAVLTLLARPAISGSVPCFVFDASSPRSGKSRQTDAIHLIATGRKASRMTYPEADDELEKVLAGYVVGAAATINFDNVARKFGGAALDKLITSQDVVDLRVLGATGVHTYPWRGLIFASGNNVLCRGDMLARVLSIRIESPLENPETRADFAHPDLLDWVAASRPRLVAAALTVLRGYACAGRPDMKCAKWGGFEGWAALIPPAIIHAGGVDPMGARRGLVDDDDPDRTAQSTLVDGWARLCSFSLDGLTTTAALAVLYPAQARHEEREPDGHDDTREAIEVLVRARPGINASSRQLGDVIRGMKHRPIGGRKFTAGPKSHGAVKWKVVAS